MINKKTGYRRLAKFMRTMQAGDVISDKAFNKGANGGTMYSLAIWEKIKTGLEPAGFYKAVMTYNREKPYNLHTHILTLHHISGITVKLHGVNAGYGGTGSRGTVQVLTDCGFYQPERVLTPAFETFTFKKRVVNTSERV